MPENSTMLSKTASAPALVKVRGSATQALLRATAAGDTRAMRTLALRCGAELSGVRAYNKEGNAPLELLAKMEHMTPQQKVTVKRQLIELPRLMDAHSAARTGAVTGAVTAALSPKASVVCPRRDGKKQTLSERDHSVKFAMATLGESVSDPAGTFEAVLNRPHLLKAPPDSASRTLKSLCTTLRNEELAVRTIKKNSSLLEIHAKKFEALVPVLMGLIGAEETAYAIAVRPEMVELDRPQLIRDTVKSIADSVGSYVDAMWLICQTLTPSSIKVQTRKWVHEEIAGTFLRLRGVRVHNRPVYKKPAKTLAHHGAVARDVYLVFQEGSTSSEDRWVFTPSFDEKKLRVARDSEVVKVMSARTSPDQACKVWSVRHAETGEWVPDPYVLVQDGKTPRGRGLLTVSQQNIQIYYNFVKEAVGPFWLEGGDGAAAAGTRFVGNLRRGDPLHMDCSEGKFKSFGDFAPSQRFGYIQTTNAARSQPLVLQAWEPISVYLLFDAEPPAAAPVEEKVPDPKDKKKGGKAPDPPPADDVDPNAQYWHDLALGGWLPYEDPLGQLKLPELSGARPISKVLVRGFIRGRVEIPAHAGSGSPPLIFIKTTIAAESGRPAWSNGSGLPCQPYVVARPGELLYNVPEPADLKTGYGESEAEVALPPKLDMVGEVGYAAGYSMMRSYVPEGPCNSSQTQMLIDTEDPIRVIAVWFHVPPPPPIEEAEPATLDPKGKAKAAPAAKGAPAPAPPVEEEKPKAVTEPVPIPSPPPWVAAERWKTKEVNSPVSVKTSHDQTVLSSYIFTKDFEPGQIFIGGADDAAMGIFWLALRDPRPHPVQKLLLRRPSLLGSGDIFAILFRRLRIELGTARARKVIIDRMNDWSEVCETGEYEEVDAWVAERKMEAFGEDLRGVEKARSLTERAPDLLDVTAPEMTERCAVLEDALGGKRSMMEAVTALPELLLINAKSLRRSVEALWSIFDREAARRLGLRLPRLLLCCEKLETLLTRLQTQFPEVAKQRLQERSSGEWVRWTDMVDQSGDVVATWLGRITAEERNLASQDRIQLSGMHGKVRSA
jgi:hypothetical protein